MSRAGEIARRRIEAARKSEGEAVEGEVIALGDVGKPEQVPAAVWTLMQENGALATQRLHELLTSARFHRLKASDQARLIALAQDRAYGKPTSNKATTKTVTHISDATAQALPDLATRSQLPEYRRGANSPDKTPATAPLEGKPLRP